MRVPDGITVILSQLYSVYIWNDSHENPHILCTLSVSQSLVSLSMINSFALQEIFYYAKNNSFYFSLAVDVVNPRLSADFALERALDILLRLTPEWTTDVEVSLERFANISDRNDVALIFLVYYSSSIWTGVCYVIGSGMECQNMSSSNPQKRPLQEDNSITKTDDSTLQSPWKLQTATWFLNTTGIRCSILLYLEASKNEWKCKTARILTVSKRLQTTLSWMNISKKISVRRWRVFWQIGSRY